MESFKSDYKQNQDKILKNRFFVFKTDFYFVIKKIIVEVKGFTFNSFYWFNQKRTSLQVKLLNFTSKLLTKVF